MSELSEAISEMRNMRESYDQIGAAAEAYNTGKTELAANITAKGVQASATETLPELAEKVAMISQDTYEINGGEMYAKQLFGVANNDIVPGYWNLYDVLAQLLSDGRLVSYGGILLAEYYRGYDSLALSGAGAGGAYVVSDKDSDGNFIIYTEDTTHTWDTEFDGKCNRWVAYCFADEYHDFQITDTNTSPRSIFIGRKVGTITSLVNARISQIVVPDGSELNCFDTSGHTQNFGTNFVLRNLKNTSGVQLFRALTIEKVYISGDTLSGIIFSNWSGGGDCLLSSMIIECNTANSLQATHLLHQSNLSEVVFKCTSGIVSLGAIGDGLYAVTPTLRRVIISDAEDLKAGLHTYSASVAVNFKTIYIGYKTNDKTKTVELLNPERTYCDDLVLQQDWCKPLKARLPRLTKANVQAHIFDRLGVNDLSTGAVTITLATAVLNLFTQEEIDAVVARTNITIVGA